MPTSSQPKISVVMTVRNGEAYIGAAIDSVRRQTMPDWELIVVDDSSTDRSTEVVAKLADQDSRVRWFRNERTPGRSESLNMAIDSAAAPWVANLDADDVAPPYRLERQLDYLQHHPDVLAVGGQADFLVDEKVAPGFEALPLEPERIAAVLPNGCCFVHSTMAMNRAAVQSLGGYRNAYPPCEDYDLWLRLSERGKLANLPDVLVQYRMHRQQLTTTRIRRMALLTLVARQAASFRRTGRAEPVISPTTSEPDLLRLFEIPPGDYDQTLLVMYLARMLQFRRLGMADIADAMAAQLREESFATYSRRHIRAQLVWARRLDHAGWKKAIATLYHGVTASLIAPQLLVDRVRGLYSGKK